MRWLAPVHAAMDEKDLKAIVEAGERVIRKVGMIVDGIESASNQCPLSSAQRRELQKILDAADRELG